MNVPITRQPVGPGGPDSLRSLRNDEVDAGTSGVRAACRTMILEGKRPSIQKVSALSGLSTTSINRERYKGIVRAGRACFDLVAQGMPYPDAVAVVGEYMEQPEKTPNAVADPVVGALLVKVSRLEAEVARRDGQLYHTLGIVTGLRAGLRWHRARLRELGMEVEALTHAPLPPRTPMVWTEDMANEAAGAFFDDEDDDDDVGRGLAEDNQAS